MPGGIWTGHSEATHGVAWTSGQWPPLQPIVREAEESRDVISTLSCCVFIFAALIFVMKLTNTNHEEDSI